MDTLYLVQARVPDGKGDWGEDVREKYVRAVGERAAIAAAQDEDTVEILNIWPVCTGSLRPPRGHPRRRYNTQAADTVRAAIPYLAQFAQANAETQAALEEIEAL